MDKLGICNMALAHIGATPILSLTEESEEARRVVQFYDNDRRVVLRRCPWPWARRRAELTALQTVPLGYAYAFRYPTNCLYLRNVFTVDTTETVFTPVEYSIASDSTGRVLYADEARVIVDYTADIEDVSLMDEQFCEVLSWKLAASVAFKLVGNPEVTQLATQEYERLCQEAIANALNEQNNALGKATNKLTVCNMALTIIGEPTIESTADVSEQARRCSQCYETDRKIVLRRYPWPWATRRVNLVALETHPTDYDYAYRYPSDSVCLRKLYARNEDGQLEPLPDFQQYKIVSDDQGWVLYTNAPSAVAEYTADIDDNELMDEQFREVLAWKLAASVAARLSKEPKITQMATAEYERLYSEAIANATNEQNIETPPLNTFIRARFGG